MLEPSLPDLPLVALIVMAGGGLVAWRLLVPPGFATRLVQRRFRMTGLRSAAC
jgi:hypothetical protein